jgi:hypothetical protein
MVSRLQENKEFFTKKQHWFWVHKYWYYARGIATGKVIIRENESFQTVLINDTVHSNPQNYELAQTLGLNKQGKLVMEWLVRLIANTFTGQSN